MRRVHLQGTNLQVSRMSFGTASLHHLPTGARRQNLLAAANEHGFSHFDTAPYYGFGLAEQELGRFLKRRRGKVTVATKVGMYAPAGSGTGAASVWMRKSLGKLVPALSQAVVDWTLAAATRSLETSLRRLGLERIDLLLLHEPTPDAVPADAFLEWLRKERDRDRIGAWGVAGRAAAMGTWLSEGHPLAMVVQARDSLDRREADFALARGREPQITYGYLAAPIGARSVSAIREVLLGALRRNSTGSVLVSTRKVSRVGELAAAAIEADGAAG